MTNARVDLTCVICSETVDDPQWLSDCDSCGSFYHLNPFHNREGKDCGNVFPGDQEDPVLQFFCNRCLGNLDEPAATEVAEPAAPTEAAPPPLEASQRPAGRRFRRIDR